MAAEAAGGFVTVLRETVEMLAMKMNVWELRRLFLGDLSLAVYKRETGWIDTNSETVRGWRGKQTEERQWRRKDSCCFHEGQKGLVVK